MGALRDNGWQPLDDSGAIMAGAKAYWYTTGTSTPKDTYSDKAMTDPNVNANPVVADAAGRFGAIFGLEDEGYRLKLTDADDNVIYTKEEQFAKSLSVDELTRRKEIARSPMDYGAAGDGATDDYTAIAAAITAMESDGEAPGILDLEGKTYRVDSPITLSSKIKIRNGVLDFSQAASTFGLSTSATTSTALSCTATAGTQTITPTSVSGYSVGDLIRVRSSDTLASGHKYAELFRIEQISGGDLIVDGVILGTYSTLPFVEEILAPATDITIEDLTIISPDGGYACYFQYAERLTIRNVKVQSTSANEGLVVADCYGVDIVDCFFYQKTSAEAGGIIVADASRDVRIDGCNIERALQAIEIGDDYGTYDGITRDVTVENCKLVWCGQIEVAEGAAYTIIQNNSIICDINPSVASTAAILLGGFVTRVVNNTIRNPEGVAIKVTQLVDDNPLIEIKGNTIIGGETHAIHVTNTSLYINHVVIAENTISAPAGDYVIVEGSPMVLLEVTNNTCKSGTGSDIAINLSNEDGVDAVNISGNHIELGGGTYTHGIKFASSCYSINIGNNNIWCQAAGTQTAIYADTLGGVGAVVIHDNVINQHSGTAGPGIGIYAASALDVVINGNSIKLDDNTSVTAMISVSGVTRLGIFGNVLYAGGGTSDADGILLSSCKYATISGNQIYTVSGNGIKFTTGVASGVAVISGNVVYCSSPPADSFIINMYAAGSVGNPADIIIIGNSLIRGNDSDSNICHGGTITGGFAAIGNVITNGTYGIEVAATGKSINDGNVFLSISTSNTTGTFTTAGDSAS